jgi:hypothetical protein
MACLIIEYVEDPIEPSENFVPSFPGFFIFLEQRRQLQAKNVENRTKLPRNVIVAHQSTSEYNQAACTALIGTSQENN